MTNNELITELVTYDGYKDIGNNTFINDVDNGYLFTIPELNEYLTDMNILHRIAVKVVRELFSLNSDTDDFYRDMEIGDVREQITRTFLIEPNEQGEHIQLAEAIVNAIRYISANKD